MGWSRAGGPHLGPGMPRFLLLHTIPRALSSPQLIFKIDFKVYPSPPGRIELPKQFPKDAQARCTFPLLGECTAEGPGPHLGDISVQPHHLNGTIRGPLSPGPCESAQGWGAFPSADEGIRDDHSGCDKGEQHRGDHGRWPEGSVTTGSFYISQCSAQNTVCTQNCPADFPTSCPEALGRGVEEFPFELCPLCESQERIPGLSPLGHCVPSVPRLLCRDVALPGSARGCSLSFPAPQFPQLQSGFGAVQDLEEQSTAGLSPGPGDTRGPGHVQPSVTLSPMEGGSCPVPGTPGGWHRGAEPLLSLLSLLYAVPKGGEEEEGPWCLLAGRVTKLSASLLSPRLEEKEQNTWEKGIHPCHQCPSHALWGSPSRQG